MAGAMRKMAVYLGLVEDDQYDDDALYSSDSAAGRDRVQDADVTSTTGRTSRYPDSRSDPRGDTLRVTDRDTDDLARRRQGDRYTSERPSQDWRTDTRADTVANEPVGTHPAGSRAKTRPGPKAGADGYKITTLHPRSYNDARRIGEEFRDGVPVIMNLTELDDTDAKRIVDFAAGLVFGLRGSIERVTNKVFMLSPANVQVGADQARAQLEQDGLMSRR